MNKALVVNFSPDDGSGMGKTADRIRSFVGSGVSIIFDANMC